MYYLPIYVNNRRMHVVKLDRPKDNQTLFTFLVNASNHYDVFSLPSENIQMICGIDGEENVNLKNAYFKLETTDAQEYPNLYRHSKGVTIYNVMICEGKEESQILMDGKNEGIFRFEGKVGDTISDGGIPFTLKALCGSSCPKNYILQFSFLSKDRYGTISPYIGAIRICEYVEDNEYFEASLDFGSEASQIHKSTIEEADNMNIRDAFVKLANGSIEKDYWQGRKNDDKTLYKSIYHVHKRPGETKFGDLPMNNGDDTFLQSLLEVTAKTEDFILLPNLKLMEQLNQILDSNSSIDISKLSFMDSKGITNSNENLKDLKDKELKSSLLRMILCNFLAVTMNSEKSKNYLYFILLVPNVYRQEKVYKLITDLYDDFYLIREKDTFQHYKGIEVSIVSESDASFFGVRALSKQDKFPYVKDAHYLIIDAGKGTTDFSIVAQEGRNLSNYVSLYRSGIPASGHILTYAFYDALRGYFHGLKLGEWFDKIMKESVGKETADVLNFVSLLEQFKIKYNTLTESNLMDDDAQKLKNNNNNTLGYLNTFLKSVLNDKRLIPGMKNALAREIDFMVTLIKSSIDAYTKKKKFVFEKIILTGRAFMLVPFKNAVSKMLVEEGFIKSEGDIFYEDYLTKSMCTFGAIKVGKQSIVNKNSNMLGSPDLIEKFGDKQSNRSLCSRILDISRRIRGKNKPTKVQMSFDFFYEGLRLSNVRNAIFTLSGAEWPFGDENTDNLYVYYVGDGYLSRHGRKCKRIEFVGPISELSNDERKRLEKEAMFPFRIESFGLTEAAKQYKSAADDSARQPQKHDSPQTQNDTPHPFEVDDSDLNR